MPQEKKVIKLVEIRGEKYDVLEWENTCGVCCFHNQGCCPQDASANANAYLMCDGSNNGGIDVYYQPHTEATVTV